MPMLITLRLFVQRYMGWLLLTAAVLVGVFLGVRYGLQGPATPVLAVVQRDFVQTVVASGHVESPHRVELGAQVTGTVLRIPVAEGQTVTAGQTLIELESTELQAALHQAQLAVAQAQAKLRQVHEVQAPVAEQAERQAQANQDAATQALQRAQSLFNQGFIGQAALDESKRSESVARAQLRSTQQQLRSASSGGSDLAVAESALSQAQAGADVARARLRYAQIQAPVAGTLIARNVEPGDVVQPGKVLMVLSPAGETQLVVQMDEKHLNLLKLGQVAQASADAYAGQRFSASLVFINPGVDAQRGSVLVKLQVPQPPAYLTQDMTVSVDIEVGHRRQAVLLPTEAVHDLDGASPWVLRVVDGRAVHTPVQLGLRTPTLCEVLGGLKAGDWVVPITAALVLDNARVRAMPPSVTK
ncbi:efflux RND transporter periplasmic adaptor subunit [Limnohabitans sp. TS-CS-82]|uniref:efflux RND transporter periplasmic adaptor subunit n=1 Tax=Limnohabitans sp. TS-CS-82 TaxID=2094193 RepID=UPI000CF232CF|nr:efflux RND transporter periplasmic adaptor subunit [Limnohabitans sp. TS-CS-82]PQA83138.1 efflux RND transporter periplasmic adaptor subunit [Limnohabitans sp. TS-CS-82]